MANIPLNKDYNTQTSGLSNLASMLAKKGSPLGGVSSTPAQPKAPVAPAFTGTQNPLPTSYKFDPSKTNAARELPGDFLGYKDPNVDTTVLRSFQNPDIPGQMVLDKSQPTSVIQSLRTDNSAMRRAILGDRPSYLFQVDHIIPLFAGGSDTPENYEVLRIDEHDKKTKVQSVINSLWANGKITDSQMKQMILSWKTLDPTDITTAGSGDSKWVDLAEAERIKARWDDQSKHYKGEGTGYGFSWKDWLKTIPEGFKSLGKSADETWSTAAKDYAAEGRPIASAAAKYIGAAPVSFTKGATSGLSFGWIQYEPKEDKTWVDTGSEFLGELGGMFANVGAIMPKVVGAPGAAVRLAEKGIVKAAPQSAAGKYLAGRLTATKTAAQKGLEDTIGITLGPVSGTGVRTLIPGTAEAIAKAEKKQLLNNYLKNFVVPNAMFMGYNQLGPSGALGAATGNDLAEPMNVFWRDLAFSFGPAMIAGGSKLGSSTIKKVAGKLPEGETVLGGATKSFQDIAIPRHIIGGYNAEALKNISTDALKVGAATAMIGVMFGDDLKEVLLNAGMMSVMHSVGAIQTAKNIEARGDGKTIPENVLWDESYKMANNILSSYVPDSVPRMSADFNVSKRPGRTTEDIKNIGDAANKKLDEMLASGAISVEGHTQAQAQVAAATKMLAYHDVPLADEELRKFITSDLYSLVSQTKALEGKTTKAPMDPDYAVKMLKDNGLLMNSYLKNTNAPGDNPAGRFLLSGTSDEVNAYSPVIREYIKAKSVGRASPTLVGFDRPEIAPKLRAQNNLLTEQEIKNNIKKPHSNPENAVEWYATWWDEKGNYTFAPVGWSPRLSKIVTVKEGGVTTSANEKLVSGKNKSKKADIREDNFYMQPDVNKDAVSSRLKEKNMKFLIASVGDAKIGESSSEPWIMGSLNNEHWAKASELNDIYKVKYKDTRTLNQLITETNAALTPEAKQENAKAIAEKIDNTISVDSLLEKRADELANSNKDWGRSSVPERYDVTATVIDNIKDSFSAKTPEEFGDKLIARFGVSATEDEVSALFNKRYEVTTDEAITFLQNKANKGTRSIINRQVIPFLNSPAISNWEMGPALKQMRILGAEVRPVEEVKTPIATQETKKSIPTTMGGEEVSVGDIVRIEEPDDMGMPSLVEGRVEAINGDMAKISGQDKEKRIDALFDVKTKAPKTQTQKSTVSEPIKKFFENKVPVQKQPELPVINVEETAAIPKEIPQEPVVKPIEKPTMLENKKTLEKLVDKKITEQAIDKEIEKTKELWGGGISGWRQGEVIGKRAKAISTKKAISNLTKDPEKIREFANMVEIAKKVSNNGRNIQEGYDKFIDAVNDKFRITFNSPNFDLRQSRKTDLNDFGWLYKKMALSGNRRVLTAENGQMVFRDGPVENQGSADISAETYNESLGLSPKATELVKIDLETLRDEMYEEGDIFNAADTRESDKFLAQIEAFLAKDKQNKYIVLGTTDQGAKSMLAVRYEPAYLKVFEKNPTKYLTDGEAPLLPRDQFLRVYAVDVLGLPKDTVAAKMLKRIPLLLNKYDPYVGKAANKELPFIVLPATKQKDHPDTLEMSDFVESAPDEIKKQAIEAYKAMDREDGVTIMSNEAFDTTREGTNQKMKGEHFGMKMLLNGVTKGGERAVVKGYWIRESPAIKKWLKEAYGVDIPAGGFVTFDSNVKIGPKTGLHSATFGDISAASLSYGKKKSKYGMSIEKFFGGEDEELAKDLILNTEKRAQKLSEFTEKLQKVRGQKELTSLLAEYADEFHLNKDNLFTDPAVQDIFEAGGAKIALAHGLEKLTKNLLFKTVLNKEVPTSAQIFVSLPIPTHLDGPDKPARYPKKGPGGEVIIGNLEKRGLKDGDQIIVYRQPILDKTNIMVKTVRDADKLGLAYGDEMGMMSPVDERAIAAADQDGDTFSFFKVGEDGGLPESLATTLSKKYNKILPIVEAEKVKFDSDRLTVANLSRSLKMKLVGSDQTSLIRAAARVMYTLEDNDITFKIFPSGGQKLSKYEIWTKNNSGKPVRVGYGLTNGIEEGFEATPKWGERGRNLGSQASQEAVDSSASLAITKRTGGEHTWAVQNFYQSDGKPLTPEQAFALTGNSFSGPLKAFSAPFALENDNSSYRSIKEVQEDMADSVALFNRIKNAGRKLTPLQEEIIAISKIKPFEISQEVRAEGDKRGVAAVKSILSQLEDSTNPKVKEINAVAEKMRSAQTNIYKKYHNKEVNKLKTKGDPSYNMKKYRKLMQEEKEVQAKNRETLEDFFFDNLDNGKYTDEDIDKIAYWAVTHPVANFSGGYDPVLKKNVMGKLASGKDRPEFVFRPKNIIATSPTVKGTYYQAMENEPINVNEKLPGFTKQMEK